MLGIVVHFFAKVVKGVVFVPVSFGTLLLYVYELADQKLVNAISSENGAPSVRLIVLVFLFFLFNLLLKSLLLINHIDDSISEV